MKTIGGINFDKFSVNINRISTHVNENYRPSGDWNKEYEMPYYKYEHDLEFNGRELETEESSSMFMNGFKGHFSVKTVVDDNHLSHERMRK